MNRAGGPSDVDKWLTQIAEFTRKSTRTLADPPATSRFVTDGA